jgi:2-iminobutanoate/2-iminopropanoate deaminase
MTKSIVSTKSAPDAIGPYSQAVRIGDLVYTSGQIPLDPDTMEVVAGNIVEQTRRALDNLMQVLAAAGADSAAVIKTTCFLSDMNNFGKFNQIYAEYFTEAPPARSCVEVARLPKDVMVEIEAIALVA